ncbi:MAG TPA: hypothetical protein VGN16_25440 [Acidobacteriaceae bacterium]|jgi:type II secretory pathway component GspD/PulD (secretin)
MKRFAYLLALTLCFGIAAETLAQTPAASSASKPSVHSYRLLYTLSESDNGKKIGVQHFMLTVNNDSGRADLKIGSKVPISTGGVSKDGKFDPSEYQIQYLDVGLNISVVLNEIGGNLQLNSKIEQSSVIDSPAATTQHPVIRQTVLSNTALLKGGETVALGAIDIPGSTRHLDIEVRMERVD